MINRLTPEKLGGLRSIEMILTVRIRCWVMTTIE